MTTTDNPVDLSMGMVKQVQTNSVKLIKGQRDNYGWEVKVSNDDLIKAVAELKQIDKKLKEEFGNGKQEIKGD